MRWVGADRVREKRAGGRRPVSGVLALQFRARTTLHGEDRGGAPISPIAGRGGVCRDAVGGLARQGHHKQRKEQRPS